MNIIHFQKNKNAQSPFVPFPIRSRDNQTRAAAGIPARLINLAVNLT
jgi:hypothetical protein